MICPCSYRSLDVSLYLNPPLLAVPTPGFWSPEHHKLFCFKHLIIPQATVKSLYLCFEKKKRNPYTLQMMLFLLLYNNIKKNTAHHCNFSFCLESTSIVFYLYHCKHLAPNYGTRNPQTGQPKWQLYPKFLLCFLQAFEKMFPFSPS